VVILRRFFRLPLAVAAVALVGSTTGLAAARAEVVPTPSTTAPGATAPAPTVPPTTTPPTTVLPTTIPPPASPATTTAPTTAGATTSPTTGVPSVPTGGPPTTTPPPGQTAPPPVDVGPSVAAVDADVAQLAAITSYGQVKGAVAAAQQQLAAANTVLASAQSQAQLVAARHQVALTRLANAKDHMAHLALAAYTGAAYATPGSGQTVSPTGTVTQPGGLTADQFADADVLLGVVVEQTERLFTAARSVLRTADTDAAHAQATVASAQAGAAGATQGLADAQQALVVATKAATVAGAAASQASAGTPGTGARLASAAPPTTTTTAGAPAVGVIPNAPDILGPSLVTAPELAAWFASTGHQANATVPIAQLAADYLAAGAQTRVAADLAFAQSVIETGFFDFPAGGQLTGADNNFAGIGACDSCSHGWSFPDALTGVTAQLQLLEAYASPTKVATPLIGPVGVGGCCATWIALAGKWASSKTYGVEIMTVYKQILDWVIPQRLLATGLAAPGSVVPAPPGTQVPRS
jgi:hypothetical protein